MNKIILITVLIISFFDKSYSQTTANVTNISFLFSNYDPLYTYSDLENGALNWGLWCDDVVTFTFDKEGTYDLSTGGFSQTGTTFEFSASASLYIDQGALLSIVDENSIEVGTIYIAPAENYLSQFNFSTGQYVRNDSLIIDTGFDFPFLQYVIDDPYNFGSNVFVYGNTFDFYAQVGIYVNNELVGTSDLNSNSLPIDFLNLETGDEVYFELNDLSYRTYCGMVVEPFGTIVTQALIVKNETKTVGVNDEISSNIFTVFPNPVKNEINIASEEVITKLSVLNLLGETVEVSQTKSIDNLNIEQGNYLLRVDFEDGSSSIQKIVIE